MKSNRRDLLKASSAAFAALATGCTNKQSHSPSTTTSNLPYERAAVTSNAGLQVGQAVAFDYPDAQSPCLLLKLGKPVKGGVGPDKDVVAYSQLCSHQGCPVSFEAEQSRLKCPCHFTMFDPEKTGQVICGQATVPLPRIILSYDKESDKYSAEGVEGLIYGRQANLFAKELSI